MTLLIIGVVVALAVLAAGAGVKSTLSMSVTILVTLPTFCSTSFKSLISAVFNRPIT